MDGQEHQDYRQDRAQEDRRKHDVEQDTNEAADEDEGHHDNHDAIVYHGRILVRMPLVPGVDEAGDATREDREAGDCYGFFGCERKHCHDDGNDEPAAADASYVGECEQNRHHDDAHELTVVDGEYALVLARLGLADEVGVLLAVLVDLAFLQIITLEVLELVGLVVFGPDLSLSFTFVVVFMIFGRLFIFICNMAVSQLPEVTCEYVLVSHRVWRK